MQCSTVCGVDGLGGAEVCGGKGVSGEGVGQQGRCADGSSVELDGITEMDVFECGVVEFFELGGAHVGVWLHHSGCGWW